jgi:hypothetical protein
LIGISSSSSLRGAAAPLAFKLHAKSVDENSDPQTVADAMQEQPKKQKLNPEAQVQLSEQQQILTQMQQLLSTQQQQQEQQLQQQQYMMQQ